MGAYSQDPTSLLFSVAQKHKNKQTFGGQYNPNQFLDYTDTISGTGSAQQTPQIVDIGQWQNQVNQQGVKGIPDALAWNTYGMPANPENQFFRNQYESAQKIKYDVQNSYNRTPEEQEAQKNLFWLADKYNLRIDPFKKNSDDDEIYDDSFKANFGEDKEGHYSAFKDLAQKYPEMAKKITKYQNYKAETENRKAQEYDRRFGTNLYRKQVYTKPKAFDLDEWTSKAQQDAIRTNPDGTLSVDRAKVQKYLVEAHQMKLDQMTWEETAMNRLGRFAGGLANLFDSTEIGTPDYGGNDEAYALTKLREAQGDIGAGTLFRELPFNIYKFPSSLLSFAVSGADMVGWKGASKFGRSLLPGNYEAEDKLNNQINNMGQLLSASKDNNVFDMTKLDGINHGTWDFSKLAKDLGIIGGGKAVSGILNFAGKAKVAHPAGFLASMALGEVAPAIWDNIQESLFGKESHRYNKLTEYMERIYPDHKSIDEYDKQTELTQDKSVRVERDKMSKQLRAMRENVIKDIRNDPSFLGISMEEAWNRWGGMTADVLALGFAMNMSKSGFKDKTITPEMAGKFPKLNFSDNFYANIYNRMYIAGTNQGKEIAGTRALNWLASAGTDFRPTALKDINGRFNKFLEVAQRTGNMMTREALDAMPAWAGAEMLMRDGNLTDKQLTNAMQTGIAYNILGDAIAKGFQIVGARLPWKKNPLFAQLSEFKDHPALKQFGEQYDIISYGSRILGDWMANPVQGLYSATFLEDGNAVENASRYLRNEAVGDLLTGVLLAGQMAYGDRNKRNNYFQVYDQVQKASREAEVYNTIIKPANENLAMAVEKNTVVEEKAPVEAVNPNVANIAEMMKNIAKVITPEQQEEMDIKANEESKRFDEDMAVEQELESKISDDVFIENWEQEYNAEPDVPEITATDLSEVGIDTETQIDKADAGVIEGEPVPITEEIDTNPIKPPEMSEDDINDFVPSLTDKSKLNAQAIFYENSDTVDSNIASPINIKVSIKGKEHNVVRKDGKEYYDDGGNLKPLKNGMETYAVKSIDEQAINTWVNDFVARTKDTWLKNAINNQPGNNIFLAKAEVQLKKSLISAYGVNPFLAGIVNDSNIVSRDIKSLIRLSSNIESFQKQTMADKNAGIVDNIEDTHKRAFNHEMFHMLDVVFKQDKNYQKFKQEAIKALKEVHKDDKHAQKRYDERYKKFYEQQFAEAGKDIQSDYIAKQVVQKIDSERLADMWGVFVLGNEKFREERGIIGKYFKAWNDIFVDKSGNYRGLLNLWRLSNKLELFDFVNKQDVGGAVEEWIQNKQVNKATGINPFMEASVFDYKDHKELTNLNMDTKEIVSKIKMLEFGLETTSDIKNKFERDWNTFDKYRDALMEKMANQNTENPIFKTQGDLIAFATKSFIKLHPGAYENNNSSSIFIFNNGTSGKVELTVEPYNGDRVTNKLPTSDYGKYQIGESHNVEQFRLTKSGWQKAKSILKHILTKASTGKPNNSPVYTRFIENLTGDGAIVRHPDNVGVMLPVFDNNYNIVKKGVKYDNDYFRDIDGFKVNNDNRYTIETIEDPDTGEIRTNLKKDFNGELYFTQYYKFDSQIYNSADANDITRNLVQSGFYPMPGSHVAMQTLDIHGLLTEIFGDSLEKADSLFNNEDKEFADRVTDFAEPNQKIQELEHSLFKYFLESQYAQEEGKYLGQHILPTNEKNDNISIVDLMRFNHDGSGKLVINLNPEAIVVVEGKKKRINELSENERNVLGPAILPVKMKMQTMLNKATEFCSPLATYHLNGDLKDKFKVVDNQGAEIPLPDLWLSELLSNPYKFVSQFLNSDKKIIDLNNKEIPPHEFKQLLFKTMKNILIDKFTAVLDQQFLSVIDGGGKSFILSGKYNNKYISSLTHEWKAPEFKQIMSSLKERRGVNGHTLINESGNLTDFAPRGVSLINDENGEQQLALNTYIFDPDVWSKQYPEETKEISNLLAILGKGSIDGATIMLNNDPNELNPKSMSIQEFLGIIGGVAPTGSYKNRLHIGTPEGTIELKHAMHPLTYDKDGLLTSTPGKELLARLVSTLRAGNVGAIVMKSALKGDGTHSLKVKEINGKEYGVGVFGEIRAEYDPNTQTFVSIKTPEGQDPVLTGIQTIPLDKEPKVSPTGAIQIDEDLKRFIGEIMFQIPLTGKNGLSWGDGQKGKPHSITGSAPFRFASFSKNSKYMIPNGQSIDLGAPFMNNANNAITNWVKNMSHDVMDLHNAFGDISDYVSGLSNDMPSDKLDNVKNMLVQLKDYLENRTDRERDLDADQDDFFMQASLNYSTDTTDYKNALRLINQALDDKDFSMASIAPLIGMTDSIMENSYTTRMLNPLHSMTGINTVFWQMMKFKHKNLVNLKGRGTMSVFVPNVDNSGDLARMQKLVDQSGANAEFSQLAKEVIDEKTGMWKDGSQAISVSKDILDKFKLKPGDNVFCMLVPPDSAISCVPMKVMGILADGNQNAIGFNSKLALEFWGRDHDIDQVSLMVNDKNWKDKQGNDGFEFLHNTLTSHLFHQGKPKQNLVDAKKILDQWKDYDSLQSTISVNVRGKKNPVQYKIPNFDALADVEQFRNTGIFDNKYEKRGYPALAPLDVDSPHESRAYFSNKKIGVAASLANKMGTLMHMFDGEIKKGVGEGLIIDSKEYSLLFNELKKNGITTPNQSIQNLKFSIKHNDDRYDAHLPYVKEGTVDTYSQMPIKFQPYTWMATMMVDNVSYMANNDLGTQVTNIKFADIDDPVVRLYIAGQLHDLEKEVLSGQYGKDVFDNEAGYSYNTIRERLSALSQGKKVNQHSLRSSIGNVLRQDFGISANDKMEISNNRGYEAVRNYENIDDIISDTFKSLFFDNVKFGDEPRPTIKDKKRASFNADKGGKFNIGVANFKAKMIHNATSGLQTLFHFGLIGDKLLPNELFKYINTMAPQMVNPDGTQIGKQQFDTNLLSTKNGIEGSEYFKTIDRMSRLAFGWLSAFDSDYVTYKDSNKEPDWSMPNIDKHKENALLAMQSTFRQLITSDVNSAFSPIQNNMLTSSFLNSITKTFMEAEINSNNRNSMIYHKDQSGQYKYLRNNSLPLLFPDRVGTTAKSTMDRWTDKQQIELGGKVVEMSANMYINEQGNPSLFIKKGDILVFDGEADILMDTAGLARRVGGENPKDQFQAMHFVTNIVQAMTIGGKAYASNQGRENQSLGSIGILGAIPNKQSHKQNFLRLLYTNLISEMGDRVASYQDVRKLFGDNANLGQELNPRLIKNLVAGAIMGNPLGGESFNRLFGSQIGNPISDGLMNSQIIPRLDDLTRKVVGMYPDKAEAKKQLGIVTGKDSGVMNSKVDNLNAERLDKGDMRQNFTGTKKPGDILSYLNILEDMSARYSSLLTDETMGEKPSVLNAVNSTLSEIKTIQADIVKLMNTENGKGEFKTKWSHMEELFNGQAFMFSPLGQKVMQELDNRKITPQVVYKSTDKGNIHDVRDMASYLMKEYAKNENESPREAILPNYSIFDDMVRPYESIAKLNNKVPGYIKAFRIMDNIMSFFRKNSHVNSRFKANLEDYIKDKKFLDGTPVTFASLFDIGVMGNGIDDEKDRSTRAFEVSQHIRSYFFNELANLYNVEPAERKQTLERWNAETPTDIKSDEYIARLAFEQLKSISTSSAKVLEKALNDFNMDEHGKSNTTAFLNKHAENIAEMFYVLKEYKQMEKYRLKKLGADMSIEEANNAISHVIKMNLNITRRNSPETLAKLYDTQKVLVKSSVVSLPTFDIDANGNLVESEPTAINLSSDSLSPNMFLGSTTIDNRELVVSSTGEIVLSHANAIKDLVNRSERSKNEATENFVRSMGKVTPEQEEEYNEALKQVIDILPETFSDDFRIKFMKIEGRIVPVVEFKSNGSIIRGSHSSVGMRWADVSDAFVREFRNRLPSQYLPENTKGYTNLKQSVVVEKALKNWLSIKLVAATQGVSAKHYISIIDNLSDKLYQIGDNYYEQFTNIKEELQQIVDLSLFKESPHPDMPNINVVNKESFNYLPGSSINVNQMKLNVRTKLQALQASLASDKQVEDMATFEKLAHIFKTDISNASKTKLSRLLDSALKYVSRQSDIENEESGYTMKDRMMGTAKRTSLTMNNRITMELIAMADTGERVYAGSVTPRSINNMNQLIDKSFNMASYGMLAKVYDHITSDMTNNLAPAYNIEMNSHIEPNPAVTTEVYNQLAEMRGESVAYSEQLERDSSGNYKIENGDVISVDYKKMGKDVNDNVKYRNTKGFVIEQNNKNILLWLPAKNTFERIDKDTIDYAKKGLSYDDEYSAYLDTIKNVFKSTLPIGDINASLSRQEEGYQGKHYDVVNNEDSILNSFSKNIVNQVYDQNTPWRAKMSRVRKYGIAAEALGGYQGGMKLVGALTATASAVGAFAIGNPVAGSALAGYALTQAVGYVGKQGGAIAQNYGSALLRETMPINGLFKTIKTALLQTVKETTSDTQSSITNSISTFMKDEITQKQMVTDMDRKQVDSLIQLLSKANSTIEVNDKLDKAFEMYRTGNLTEFHIRQMAVQAIENSVVPDNDYASFWLKHIDFDLDTKQYILQNGHEINSLMQLKHDLIKDRLTNLLSFGQIIAQSEESSKKLGSKVFAQYVDEEQLVTGASQNEVGIIIDKFMDRASGNYKSNNRLSKNKHGFNQLLTLYERFNRDNNAYYLGDVYKAIDKSLSIDFLAKEFGGYGKSGRGTYKTVKGIESHGEEVTKVTTAYNIDEYKAFKKKIVLATSLAVTNLMAKAGMLMLAGYVMNEEVAKEAKKIFGGLDVASGMEKYTSLGGFLNTTTHSALLAGTAMLINHNEMLNGKVNKSELKNLIKDEIRNSGSVLQNAGIGLGYSKIFELPMALGNQFMLHNMRTISPKISKMVDEESKEYWINYTTGLTKLFGVFSLAEKLGTIATTNIGLAMGNDAFKSDLAHTIKLSSTERKKTKKTKKMSEPTDTSTSLIN